MLLHIISCLLAGAALTLQGVDTAHLLQGAHTSDHHIHQAAGTCGDSLNLQCPHQKLLRLRSVDLYSGCEESCLLSNFHIFHKPSVCTAAISRILSTCHGESSCVINTEELVFRVVADESRNCEVNYGMPIKLVIDYDCVREDRLRRNVCNSVREEIPSSHRPHTLNSHHNNQTPSQARTDKSGTGEKASRNKRTTRQQTTRRETTAATMEMEVPTTATRRNGPVRNVVVDKAPGEIRSSQRIQKPSHRSPFPEPVRVVQTNATPAQRDQTEVSVSSPHSVVSSGDDAVMSSADEGHMETIIISCTCAGVTLLLLIAALVVWRCRRRQSQRRKSSSLLSVVHPAWSLGKWKSRKISATNALSAPMFAYMDKQGVFCIVCYDRGHPDCQGHADSRSSSFSSKNRQGFNFLQSGGFLEKGVTDSHIYSGIVTEDERLGGGLTVEYQADANGNITPAKSSVKDYLQRAYSSISEMGSPTKKGSNNSSLATSVSELHFDIPEEMNEEDYEDILFDRRNSIPIDMHPIEVDTSYKPPQTDQAATQ